MRSGSPSIVSQQSPLQSFPVSSPRHRAQLPRSGRGTSRPASGDPDDDGRAPVEGKFDRKTQVGVSSRNKSAQKRAVTTAATHLVIQSVVTDAAARRGGQAKVARAVLVAVQVDIPGHGEGKRAKRKYRQVSKGSEQRRAVAVGAALRTGPAESLLPAIARRTSRAR